MARILVVDDEPANRLLLKTVLEHAGHTVIEAAEAVKALSTARAEEPDLAIVDLHLAETSGVELVQQLRSDPTTQTMRIAIYTSSKPTMPVHDFMIVYGITHVIPKPCEPPELLAAVEFALS